MAKKLKGLIPDCEVKDTDAILFSGDVPECITSEDCNVDVRQLTFLLQLLLDRYCESENIVDADLSSIDLACLIEDNPDITVPDTITIETLMAFYKDHICALYDKISDLETAVANLIGLVCLNDLVQLNQDTSIDVDPLFNDITTQVSGTLVITITTDPLNGTAVLNPDKTITYTPDPGFIGNDFMEYTVTKGGKTCTARINIKVNEVLSEEDLDAAITTKVIEIMSSNEYWDIGIPVGTKMAISDANLVDFNFSGMTPGKGIVATKWAKWAICNGFNLADDFTQSTFRGFDHTDANFNGSTVAGGSDTVSLIRDNIPAHRHAYDFVIGDDSGTPASGFTTQFGGTQAGITGAVAGAIWNSGSDHDFYRYGLNTGDGTNNVSNQHEIANGTGTVTAVNIMNAYKTLILVQKVDA